jgi:hypothetical protein
MHKGIISAVRRVEFGSDMLLHIVLRGHLRHVLNVHAATEDKSDNVKGSFYECVFDRLCKYHMKRGFSAKVGREDISQNSQEQGIT